MADSSATTEGGEGRLILHFSVPFCLTPGDTYGTTDVNGESKPTTTQYVLDEILTNMSWGSIEPETKAWQLASTELSKNPPEFDTSLITYKDYLVFFFLKKHLCLFVCLFNKSYTICA